MDWSHGELEASTSGSLDDALLAAAIGRVTEILADGLRQQAGIEPLEALAAARSLRMLLDDAVGALVGRARAGGASWARVGAALGMTRQAAFERFAHRGMEDEEVYPVIDPKVADQVAHRALEFVLEGHDEEFLAGCDDRVRAGLSGELLASIRQQLATTHGGLLTVRLATVRAHDEYQVVDMPLVFERGVRIARFAVDPTGLVAGFFLVEGQLRQ